MNYLSQILNSGIYHYHKKQLGGLGRWMAASEERVRLCPRSPYLQGTSRFKSLSVAQEKN